MPHKAFDNYLQAFRMRSGLSQEELSFLLGRKSGARISRYENGKQTPSLEILLALEAIFGVSVGALYWGRFLQVESSVRERAEKLFRALEGAPRRNRTRAILTEIYSKEPRKQPW